MGEEPHKSTEVNTGGGAGIGGNVSASGSFVGRDVKIHDKSCIKIIVIIGTIISGTFSIFFGLGTFLVISDGWLATRSFFSESSLGFYILTILFLLLTIALSVTLFRWNQRTDQ